MKGLTRRQRIAAVGSCRIRPLRPADYDALLALWKEAGLPYRPMGRDSRRNIAKQLRLPESIFLVAELNHGGDTTEVRNQKSEVRTGYSDFSNQHSDFRCSVPIPKGEKARRSTGKKGRLVGAVLGTHDGRKGWINRLTVAPAYRHRGIAARLVAEVEKRLRRTGIAIISALIEDGNQTSMQAFARLGYEERRDIVYFVKRRRADI